MVPPDRQVSILQSVVVFVESESAYAASKPKALFVSLARRTVATEQSQQPPTTVPSLWAQRGKVVTCVTNFMNSGAYYCAKAGSNQLALI